MSHKPLILLALYAGITFLTAETVAAQAAQAPYDTTLISKAAEINLAFSTQRGIRDSDGTVYYISSNRRFVEAYRGNKLQWKADAAAACSHSKEYPEIRYIRLDTALLSVVVGKHAWVSINKATGEARFAGSD